MRIVRPKLLKRIPPARGAYILSTHKIIPSPWWELMYALNGRIIKTGILAFEEITIPANTQFDLYTIPSKLCRHLQCSAATEAERYDYCYDCWKSLDSRFK